MSYYIIKVIIVPPVAERRAVRTTFALQRNARYLCCTSEHLNPCVVHILADEHPSDRQSITTVAQQREVIMNDVNPYKHFHSPLDTDPPRREVPCAEKSRKPLSRRSRFELRPFDCPRTVARTWCEVIMNGLRPYKGFRNPGPRSHFRRNAVAEKSRKPLSRGSDSKPVHPTARGQSLASGAR
jgi:hypothetical protein